MDKEQNMNSLAIAALGIVFGDIATSPLYAVNEIFFGRGQVPLNTENVLGAISLSVWALILIISVKYVCFVLKADNDSQGGVFALYSILYRYRRLNEGLLLAFLMFSAGMLLGDGIITPAISVLAAVEGLNVATPFFSSAVVPIAISILLLLFSVQHMGTSRVGRIFGPIMAVWLFTLGVTGAIYILREPSILRAANPLWGIRFLFGLQSLKALAILGLIMLVITGGEALYADLGHFGREPIKRAWFYFVLPSLILNYLGQGAFLLSENPSARENIFFSMLPAAVIYPIVLLATLAAVIASQALISGAFSLVFQAIGLNLFPRLRVLHTHEGHHGQIYIGVINWLLCLGCILLVYFFRSTSALASAYGLAISTDMFTTSVAMIFITRRRWLWERSKAFLVFGTFAAFDALFLIANSQKFFEGGYVPFGVGVFLFVIMQSWSWGREATSKSYKALQSMTMKELVEIKSRAQIAVNRTVILMCPRPIVTEHDHVPALLQHYVERYSILPRNIILLDVFHRTSPYVHDDRYLVRTFLKDSEKGNIVSVTVNFGFMEEPNVESVLEELARHHEIDLTEDPHSWHVHASMEHLIPSAEMPRLQWLKFKIYTLLRANSLPAYYYYGLGNEVKLSIDVFPMKISDFRQSN